MAIQPAEHLHERFTGIWEKSRGWPVHDIQNFKTLIEYDPYFLIAIQEERQAEAGGWCKECLKDWLKE